MQTNQLVKVTDEASPHAGRAGRVVKLEGDTVRVVLDGDSDAADMDGNALGATDFRADQLQSLGQI